MNAQQIKDGGGVLLESDDCILFAAFYQNGDMKTAPMGRRFMFWFANALAANINLPALGVAVIHADAAIIFHGRARLMTPGVTAAAIIGAA